MIPKLQHVPHLSLCSPSALLNIWGSGPSLSTLAECVRLFKFERLHYAYYRRSHFTDRSRLPQFFTVRHTKQEMAPRKSATKATSDDSAPEELILTYLKAQNRPYSATDISANLHNKVTKTKADKLLKDLFERNEIGGKASGKQWVFWCLQVGLVTVLTPQLLHSCRQVHEWRHNGC